MLQTPTNLLRQFHPPKQSSLGTKIRLLGQAIAVSLVTIALQPTLRAENTTEDAKFNDPTSSSFASDVAVSGDFALVGASGGIGILNNLTGVVYSYHKIGGQWVFDGKFFAPDGEDGDRFGSSVAMFGDVAIIGAPNDDDPAGGDNSGSASLFRHDGSDWIFEQKITASDATSDWRFGGAVAISGTVAVVGFPKQTGAPGGAAYVFRYNGTTWVEEKILTASDAAAGDDFGVAVAVFDDVVVVGAAQKSGGGAAYIYRNTAGTTWGQEKILTASDGVEDDEFGDAVAVSGSLAIIGAYQVNGQQGAAYIYRHTGGTTWDDETMISRENPIPPVGAAGSFGGSVAISGEVALVGAAPAQSNNGTGHLFRFDGSEWVEIVLVPSNRGDFEDPSSNFWFGDSGALSGDYAMLGAAFDSGFGNNGAAYIYNLAPEITWNAPAAITYGTALSSTQLNASAGSVPGTFSYSPASGAVLDAGTQTLTANFTPTDTVRYVSTSKTVSIMVNKATPTIAWNNPATITYGTGLSDTQLNATSSAPGTITYAPAAGTVLDAGDGQILTATLPASTNFNSAEATVSINVNKATATIAWNNPAAITYGTGLSDTQLNATSSAPGTITYAPAAGTVLDAGDGQILMATLPASTNFNSAEATVSINVNKATATIAWNNPTAITYGTGLSDTQLNATSSAPGVITYAPAAGTVLDAGDGQILMATLPASTNFNSAEATVSINVNKATATIAWNNPAAITYGTGLGDTQLNATSSAPGTITYAPALGTVLDAGDDQILMATLPASTNFNGAEGMVSINVNPAPLTITADDKQRGSGLANPPLTASYSGFVNGDTAIDTPPSLTTTATPASAPDIYPITVAGGADPNYTITLQGGNLTVSAKEVPVLTWNDPAAITYGTALGAAQLNAVTTPSVEGDFEYLPAIGTVLHSGIGQALTVKFTPDDAARYDIATATTFITVNMAALSITADDKSRDQGQSNPVLTATYAGFVNGDTEASLTSPPNLSTTADVNSGVGDYPITVSGAVTANYNITYVDGVLTVESAAVLAAKDDSFRVPLFAETTEGYGRSSDGSHFLPVLQNDEFEQSNESIDGYSLRISDVSNIGEIAGAGQSLAILAFVGGANVHVRYFDSNGVMTDKTENELIRGNHLTELKQRLGLFAELGGEPRENPPRVISEKRRKKILGSLAYVGSYADFTTGVYFDSPNGPVDFKKTDDGDYWSVGGGFRYAPKAEFTGELSVNYRWANNLTVRQAFAKIEVVNPVETPNWGLFGEEIDGYGAYGGANALAGVGWKPAEGLAIGAAYGASYWDEIYTTVGNNDNLGGGLPVRAGLKFAFANEENNVPGIRALESNGQVLQTFEILQPGLAALAAGEGETVMFTQEMADSVATLRDMIANVSSPSLSTAVSVISENVKEEDYVGKDFNGVVGNLGIDPDQFEVRLSRSTFDIGGFSVSTAELQGIVYSLLRSASLAVDSWIQTEHEEASDGNGNITLTDPDAPVGAWFYRVETSKQEEQ